MRTGIVCVENLQEGDNLDALYVDGRILRLCFFRNLFLCYSIPWFLLVIFAQLCNYKNKFRPI